MRRPDLAAPIVGAVLLLVAGLELRAQLPLPRLLSVFPAGAQPGSTSIVAVTGTDLDAPKALAFSDPRLVALPVAESPGTFRLVVPPEVPAGLLEVRHLGRFGASNPRRFAIDPTPSPSIVAPTNHLTVASAFPLPRDTVLEGRTQPNAAHWFRFEARRGERLLIRVTARDLDSRLVPDLTVLDPDGRELRTTRRSELLDFESPIEGPLFLRLHDQLYRGGDDFVYRLILGPAPRVDFALPLAVTSGTTQSVTLFGRHLPGGTPSSLRSRDGLPLERVEMPLVTSTIGMDSATRPSAIAGLLTKPASAALAGEVFAWQPPIGAAPLPPLLLGRVPFPVLVSTQGGVLEIEPPVDVSAVFPDRGVPGGVAFAARRGSVHWIEIFADRLGFPCDPLLVIQRETKPRPDQPPGYQDLAEIRDLEANHGGREFDTATRDGALRWVVPEDGRYRVLVRDLFQNGREGRRLPYRLQVRPETPDFRLAAFPQPPPRKDDNDRQIHLWPSVLRRGETIPIRVVAFRRDGFDGPIDLIADNLPAGIMATPARIPPGQSATSLFLGADTNAPATVAAVTVIGRARIGEAEVTRPAIAAIGRWPVPNWDQERGNPRFTDALTVAVLEHETAPVSIRPVSTNPLPLRVTAGTKVSIPLEIVRHGEFHGAFKLRIQGSAALDKAAEIDVPEKATQALAELDLTATPLPEGPVILHFEGFVTGKYRANPDAKEPPPRDMTLRVYSRPLPIEVLPATKST